MVAISCWHPGHAPIIPAGLDRASINQSETRFNSWWPITALETNWTTQLQCPPSSGGMAAQSNKVWVCLTSVRSMLTKSLLMCIIFSFPFPVYVARSTQNENSKYSFFLTCHFRNWDMKKLVNIVNVCDYLVKLYFYIN